MKLTNEQQIEMLKEVESLIHVSLTHLSSKTIDMSTFCETKINDEGESFDPMLMINDYVYVTAYMGKPTSTSKERTIKSFEIGRVVNVPGVRYYPDGSGEPDSEDEQPIGSSTSPLGAARMAMYTVMQDLLIKLSNASNKMLLQQIWQKQK